jgi:hypothetical protein
MDDTKPISLAQMRAFVAAGGSAEFQAEDRAEKYACLERTLRHLDYPQLGRADKGLAKQYLTQLTGLCRAQLTRLIGRYAAKGTVTVAPSQRRKFPAHYTEADIRLLAYVDQAHGTLSGPVIQANKWLSGYSLGNPRLAGTGGNAMFWWQDVLEPHTGFKDVALA